MLSTQRNLISPVIAALIVIAALAIIVMSAASTRAPIVVQWNTASELDTAGFNLYRSENPDGPFALINAELIPSSSDPLVGGTYIFTDTDVTPGHTYYYQLEDIDTSGVASRQGMTHETTRGGLDPVIVITGAGALIVGVIAFITRKR